MTFGLILLLSTGCGTDPMMLNTHGVPGWIFSARFGFGFSWEYKKSIFIGQGIMSISFDAAWIEDHSLNLLKCP